jgi:hypothetical protein
MRLAFTLFVVPCVVLITVMYCHRAEVMKEEQPTFRDINLVLEDHSAELLAKPEVVGFYVGQLEDGHSCITVMLKSDDPEAKKNIPATLEGYPVRIEVTGEFRPMH